MRIPAIIILGLARFARFLPIYLREMGLSNIRVAMDVLRPRPQFAPGLVTVDVSGYGPTARWAAACLISMTPGTLALDLDEVSGEMTVHGLYLHDPVATRQELENLIRRALGSGEKQPEARA